MGASSVWFHGLKGFVVSISLKGLLSRFNRHLKECKYLVSVIEDVAFERARKCLEAKNKQLKKESKGNRLNAAD